MKTELKTIKEKGFLIQGKLFGLLVHYQTEKNQPSRFGFIVSTRVHKKAVKRNRARRLLSEAISSFLPKTKKSFDVVVLAKRKIIDADLKEIEREIKELFIKAGMVS